MFVLEIGEKRFGRRCLQVVAPSIMSLVQHLRGAVNDGTIKDTKVAAELLFRKTRTCQPHTIQHFH